MAETEVVRSGGKAKTRKVRKDGWTVARREAFLARLAETASITSAARAAKMSVRTAYMLRSREPGFRAAWGDALCDGYATLEARMLERALQALRPAAVPPPTGSVQISERTMISLLNLHASSVRQLREERARRDALETGETPPSADEARAAMEATLAAMQRRIEEAQATELVALPAPEPAPAPEAGPAPDDKDGTDAD